MWEGLGRDREVREQKGAVVMRVGGASIALAKGEPGGMGGANRRRGVALVETQREDRWSD